MSPRLVLFDIDGTLVSAGGISARVFGEALLEAFGTTGDADRFDYSGKTDPQIVRELMKGAGFTDEEIEEQRPRALEDYRVRLAASIRPSASPRAVPRLCSRTSPTPARRWRPSSAPTAPDPRGAACPPPLPRGTIRPLWPASF